MKRLLIVLAACNIGSSVFLLWSTYLNIGLLKMHIVGAYSDLKQSGVINVDAERTTFAEQLRHDPLYLPLDYLAGDQINIVHRLIVCACVCLFINGALLLLIALNKRNSGVGPDSGAPSAQR